MVTGETGFTDVTFDLISVQYHSLKAQDSERVRRCHEFLGRLQATAAAGPAAR